MISGGEKLFNAFNSFMAEAVTYRNQSIDLLEQINGLVSI